MKYLAAIFIVLLTGSCNDRAGKDASNDRGLPAGSTGYRWTELTAEASFPKSYNFQMFSIRDTVWVMHQEGAWYSADGKLWTKSALPNILGDNAFLDYVWFKDALYCIGTFHGNIEHYSQTTAIYRTTDMRSWDTLSANSNLPQRFFYHPVVFKEKLWIIGGTDGPHSYSDIWNSADGVHWAKQADHLPFGERDRSQFVIFKEKLYMFNNDVWSSADGLNWTQVTSRIAKKNIFGYAPVVFDDRIWLLGCNRDGVFQSQVLVSRDGVSWETQSAPWTPRGAVAACVHRDRVLMTGGKYGGMMQDGRTTEFVYSNDVWALEKDHR